MSASDAIRSGILAEMIRAIVSTGPPAANGTTSVIGRSGQLLDDAPPCADAAPTEPARSMVPAIISLKIFMVVFSLSGKRRRRRCFGQALAALRRLTR
jgi:hypothetical protein